ncbi:MAG: DUF2167 domain-containing protein [Gemmatimonadaceae bacterium]
MLKQLSSRQCLGVALIALIALLAPTTILAQRETPREKFARIQWVRGPADARLGDVADVVVPAFCRVTDEKGTKLFLEVTENPPSGREVGVLLCDDATDKESGWFVVFTYNESGLVKDDEKATLDQAAILKTLQRATEAGNDERRSRGWEEIEIVGWSRPPFYDPETHNLTWSTRLRSKSSPGETVNHSVRLLGRGGVMHADLVADPSQMRLAVAAFDSILTEYTFVPGQKYAEWKEGDKVAAFGLTALVAGGAGVAAAKLGLFSKLWKLLLGILIAGKKLIIVAVLAIGGGLAKLFGKRGAQTAESEEKAPPAPAKAGSTKGGGSTRPDLYRKYIPPNANPPAHAGDGSSKTQ